MEAESRKQVARMMCKIQADDESLAGARFEQIQMLEQTRVAKVDTWRLLQTDLVNSKVSNSEEHAIHAGAKAWWDGPERATLKELEEQLWQDILEMDAVAQKVYVRLQEIYSHVRETQDWLDNNKDTPVWDIGEKEQDAYFSLMKDTCELQVLAWKRNHIRERQFHLLQLRWKALRSQAMLRRQSTAQQVLSSDDPFALGGLYVSVEKLNSALQGKAVSSKKAIADLLTEANEAQRTLRTMKHVMNTESDSTRDKNLTCLFGILVEDVRLAWLRKEQLQTVELAGMIRAAASLGDIELPVDLPKV